MSIRGAIPAVLLLTLWACSVDRSGLAPNAPRPERDATAPYDSGSVGDAGATIVDAAGLLDAQMSVDGGTASIDAGWTELAWGAPVPVVETVDPDRCETDPVLTSDRRWLFLTRQEDSSDGCYGTRRFHLFRWNAGRPVHEGSLPRFDPSVAESNPHPLDGALAGLEANVYFFHQVNAGSIEDMRVVALVGTPPLTMGGAPVPLSSLNTVAGEGGPTLTLTGRSMVFARDEDLYETAGIPPVDWALPRRLETVSSASREGDAALSPDGRTLVFMRHETGDDFDLWVAHRAGPGMPFDPPQRLPAPINSPYAEMDSFIASDGTLLFVSAREDGTTRRVYVAPRVAP